MTFRFTTIAAVAALAACTHDKQPTEPAPFPKNANAGAVYVWCQQEAERQSPSPPWTIKGEAFVNEFVRVCMLQAGAQPVVVVD